MDTTQTELEQTRKPRKPKVQLTPSELLADPSRVTVSVSQAAQVLGVSKSTAHVTYKRTGLLCDGVPVLRVGRRCVVAVAHLRAVLGMSEPGSSN